MPTAQLLTSSADSPDTLPRIGYTADQLASYILRQLGSPVWTVELTKQQILDNINDALGLYGIWVPKIKYFAIRLNSNQFAYLQGQDCGHGVIAVDFISPFPTANAAFYANLITPINTNILFQTGMDNYDSFLRWKKTWERVTSVEPDWLWDPTVGVLYIHNPIERYHCAVTCYFAYEKTEELTSTGAQWVKEYSLEKSRYQYGEIIAKYSGMVPGPLKDLQLDSQKRDKAEARLLVLMENLKGMGTHSALQID